MLARVTAAAKVAVAAPAVKVIRPGMARMVARAPTSGRVIQRVIIRQQKARRATGGDAAHEAPGDGTRASGAMPKAVEGWHIGGLVGCWPGPGMALISLAMSLAGLCCFLACASAA